MDTAPLVVALIHLRDNEGAVPPVGRELHARIKARYVQLASSVSIGDALLAAAVEVASQELAAQSSIASLAPPEEEEPKPKKKGKHVS